MLKAPANVIWSVVTLVTSLIGKGAEWGGLERVKKTLDGIWPGFTTAVQVESERLIYQELLEPPWRDGQEKTPKNALFEEILNQPEISPWIDSAMSNIAGMGNSKKYRKRLEKNLRQFATAQVSAADIAGDLVVLAGAYVGAKKCAVGAYSAGSVIATLLAQQIAIQSFVLGPTLGGLYYSWFPASAGLGLAAASIASVALLLAVVVAFAGVITDPIQNLFRLNENRLNATLDDLEADLLGTGSKGMKTNPPIHARIFDITDILSSAANPA